MAEVLYKKKKKGLKEALTGYSFISLPLIGFLIFTAISMGVSIYYSFTDFNPVKHLDVSEANFIYFDNYIELFTKKKFWECCFNTLFLMLTLPVGMFIGLLLATYLKNLAHGSKVLRLIYYLPAVSSAVAINIVWRYIFDMDYGLINNLFNVNVPWLGVSNKWLIRFAIMIKNTWSAIGGTMLLYLAGLNSIPDSYYEAAKIDGASPIKQFFTITIPLIKPTTFYLLITGIIGGLQSYADAQVFAEGHQSAQTIVYYIWFYGIFKNRYGLACAAATILGIVIMIVTLIQFKKTKIVDI